MAEQEDKDSKTEEPSEKKINDALEKGNTPYSKEVGVLVSLLAMLIGMAFFVQDQGARLATSIGRYIDTLEDFSFETSGDVQVIFLTAMYSMATFLVPLLLLSFVLGLLSSFGQNPPRIAFDRIKVQASRISLKKGWTRLFGKQGQVEFLKAMFKFSAAALVGVVLLQTARTDVFNSMLVHPSGLPTLVLDLSTKMLIGIAVAACFLALGDFVWSRWFWHNDLRMTRQELKDEHKQLEGDPIIKAKQRSISRNRARQNMLNNVSLATVVITNPTHFAVALRYDSDVDPAPVVVAKGQDLIALRIRELASTHSIPTVENKTLARALYASVQVNDVIPSEFYKAVAEIILFLSSSKVQTVAPR